MTSQLAREGLVKERQESDLFKILSFGTQEGQQAVRKLEKLASQGIYGQAVTVKLKKSTALKIKRIIAEMEKEDEKMLATARALGRSAGKHAFGLFKDILERGERLKKKGGL